MSALALTSRKYASLLLICVLLNGCQKPESFVKYLVSGAAIGAGAGAVAMVATGGCIGCGAAVGAAVGAGIGVAFDALENKR